MKNTNQKTLVDSQGLADYLNVKRSYIYELVSQRKIPFYRPFGKKLVFYIEEIDALVQSTKTKRALTKREAQEQLKSKCNAEKGDGKNG